MWCMGGQVQYMMDGSLKCVRKWMEVMCNGRKQVNGEEYGACVHFAMAGVVHSRSIVSATLCTYGYGVW